jgi:SHS2 domain-containing protein
MRTVSPQPGANIVKKSGRPPYTVVDHTADMGLRIRGHSMKDLFRNAALALTDLLVSRGRHEETVPVPVSLTGADAVDLLVRWMGEILYMFEAESLVVEDVRIENLDSRRIDAAAQAFKLDPEVDEPLSQIKAVTYHQAKITRTGGRLEAFVILDL